MINSSAAEKLICPVMSGAGRVHRCVSTGCMMWRRHPMFASKGLHQNSGFCGMGGPPLRAVVDGVLENEHYDFSVNQYGQLPGTSKYLDVLRRANRPVSAVEVWELAREMGVSGANQIKHKAVKQMLRYLAKKGQIYTDGESYALTVFKRDR